MPIIENTYVWKSIHFVLDIEMNNTPSFSLLLLFVKTDLQCLETLRTDTGEYNVPLSKKSCQLHFFVEKPTGISDLGFRLDYKLSH